MDQILGVDSDINLLTPENEFDRAVACPSTHKCVYFSWMNLNHAQSLLLIIVYRNVYFTHYFYFIRASRNKCRKS